MEAKIKAGQKISMQEFARLGLGAYVAQAEAYLNSGNLPTGISLAVIAEVARQNGWEGKTPEDAARAYLESKGYSPDATYSGSGRFGEVWTKMGAGQTAGTGVQYGGGGTGSGGGSIFGGGSGGYGGGGSGGGFGGDFGGYGSASRSGLYNWRIGA
jgi:hypothetical protein